MYTLYAFLVRPTVEYYSHIWGARNLPNLIKELVIFYPVSTLPQN